MASYYRSLEERRLSIFEGCAGCGDDDGGSSMDSSGDMTGDSDSDPTKLMSFLGKLKKKKEKK